MDTTMISDVTEIKANGEEFVRPVCTSCSLSESDPSSSVNA
jgi:hypothetical protein